MTAVLPTKPPPIPDAQTVEPPVFLSRPGFVERVILSLALFTYAWGTPIEWFQFAADGEAESSALTSVVFLGFAIHSLASLNGNWHVVLRALKSEPLLTGLISLIAFSSLWSTTPTATLQAGIVLMVTYLCAMHLVVRFTLSEIVQMLALIFAIGALLNLIFILTFEAFDTVTVNTEGGATSGWQGITANKNSLGRACVLGFLTCVINTRSRGSKLVWPVFAAINLLIILGTNSATSLGAAIGICVLGLVFLGFRGRKTLYGATFVAMSAVFSVLTLFAATNLATFTGLLQKDATFTGRLPIWKETIEHGISARPWLGYGWEGFWDVGFQDFEVKLSLNHPPAHSHNALIDAWVQLGPLGFALLAGVYIRGLVWSTRQIRAVPTAVGMYPALVIAAAVIFSTTEAGFVGRSIQFIMLVVAVTVSAIHKGTQ